MAAATSALGAPQLSAAAPADPAGTGTATALDSSFGGGLVTSGLSPFDDEAAAVALQPDGATVVVGRTNHDPFDGDPNGDILVARYTPAGALDPAFGTGGTFVLASPGAYDTAYAVALQPDGGIVVGGERDGKGIVVRLTPAGVLDPTFQGGTVTFPEVVAGKVKALAVQVDGSIRVGGTGSVQANSGRAGAAFQARLDPLGLRDTTFAPAGLVIGPAPTDVGFGTVALVADGKLVAAGAQSWPVFGGGPSDAAAIARYLPTGASTPRSAPAGPPSCGPTPTTSTAAP